MSIIDKLKAGAKYINDQIVKPTGAWVRDQFHKVDDDDLPPSPVDVSNYLHVSVPLIPIDNPILRKILRQDYFPVRKGEGQTRIVGNNMMKRVADQLGTNNKERRRLRSKMKRRAAELRAQQVAA